MAATLEMSPGPSWGEKIVPTLRKRTCTPSSAFGWEPLYQYPLLYAPYAFIANWRFIHYHLSAHLPLLFRNASLDSHNAGRQSGC